jgi:hypothetical protein
MGDMAPQRTPTRDWLRRVLYAWIAALGGFAAIAATCCAEAATTIAAAVAFLGVFGTVGGWGWAHLFDLA